MQAPNQAGSESGSAPRFSLRARLLFILLLALLPATIFLAYDVRAIGDRAQAEAAGELLRVSKMAATTYTQRIVETKNLMAAIARFPEVKAGEGPACSARMAELAALYDGRFPGFAVSNRNGDVVCTSTSNPEPVNIGDRLWFREVLRTGEFAIGEFTIGEFAIGRRTGTPNLGLGYPITDANGQVVGVLSTALFLSWMQEQAEDLELPPDTVLTILDQDGMILARTPDSEKYIGERLTYLEMQQVRSQGSRVIEGTGADGVERLYAIAPIVGPAGTDVWLSVGRAPTAIYAEARWQVARDLMGIGMIMLAALAAIWFGSHRWIMQPMRRLVKASRQLSTGDLSTRTGQQNDGSEFGEMGAALDQMAAVLQERERHLRLALGAASMVAWTWDTQRNAVETTENFREIFGMDVDEYVKRGVDVVIPEDRPRRAQLWAEALHAGTPYHSELRLIRPDTGQLMWVDEYGAPMLDDAGQVRQITGVTMDITARKVADAQALYQAKMLESVHDAALAMDPDLNITFWNQGAEALYGWRADEVMGRPVLEILGTMLSPEQLAKAQAELRATGRVGVQIESFRRDGTPIFVDSITTAIYDANGGVRGFVTINRDVTARRQIEEELRQRAEEIEALLELLPVAVLIAHDPHARRITGNQAAYALLRAPVGANLSRSAPPEEYLADRRRFMHGREPEPFELPMQQAAMQGEEVRDSEVDYLYNDGTLLHLFGHARPLFDEHGKVRGAVGVFMDITERKRMEIMLEQRVHERTEELERSNRELDQFAYVASHDLKAPLRGIDTLSGFVLEDTVGLLPEASQRHLVQIRSRISRMEALLDDLLAYSRAGRQRYAPERFALGELVHEAVELSAAPEGFVVEVVEPMPTLVGERVPLETVLRNIIGNAIKHHDQPQTGRVVITAREFGGPADIGEPGKEETLGHTEGDSAEEAFAGGLHTYGMEGTPGTGIAGMGVVETGATMLYAARAETGVWIEVTVTDNGPGIDPVFHERVFEPFQTLRPRDEVEGSGIGLTVVKKLVETRGGKVWLESARGEGAVFRFTWPRGF